MRIECFSKSEWLQIADIISAHCPSEPIIEKFISVIDDRTNLFVKPLPSLSDSIVFLSGKNTGLKLFFIKNSCA